jgi:hypothetical protein
MNPTEFLHVSGEKGISKITFLDDFKQQCSIQQSSSTLENKIWFGVDKDINGKAIVARMHLTQEQIREIIPYLQKFASTGVLI